MLARQALYLLSHAPNTFCSGYFSDMFLIYAHVSLDHHLSICASSHSWDDRHVTTHPTFID
jgi:hypothetical protein